MWKVVEDANGGGLWVIHMKALATFEVILLFCTFVKQGSSVFFRKLL